MDPIDIDSDPTRLSLWRATRPVTLDHADSSTLIPDSWKRTWRSKSVGLATLRGGEDVFGLLAVDYVFAAHRFSQAEAHLLEAIASAAGTVLRGARLVEHLAHAIEIERRLSECAVAVQSGRSVGKVLDLVVDRFASLLAGVSCSIYLLSQDKSSLRLAADRGVAPPTSEILLDRLPFKVVDDVRQTWARDRHQPILIEDTAAVSGLHAFVPPAIGPGMLIPLSDDREILGFAAVGRERDTFTEDEVRVAGAFAGQAAVAVSQARLNDTLEARLRVIEVLNQLSDVVLRTSDLRSVVNTLNRDVCRQIGMECTRVAFTSPTLSSLLGAKTSNAEERRVLRSWRSMSAANPQRVGDSMLLPIPVGSRIAGILRVRSEAHPDPADVELIKAIAGGLGEVAYKARLRRTAEQRTRDLAVASERERIAQDLHDTLGQTFYGIGLKLQDLLADVDDPELRPRIADARSLAAQAVADLRSTVYALSFLHVKARGLVTSIRALVRQFIRTTGISVDLRIETALPKLSEETVSALYRVVHEALVNIERHARATGVVVRLAAVHSDVELSILDDGVGLDLRQAPDWRSAAHFGMRAMAKAVEEVGGRFRVKSSNPRGLVISAILPIHPAVRTRSQ